MCIPGLDKVMCGKIVGVIRILLGIAMLYFGVMKLGAGADMVAMIGGAGHKFGLTFLSTTTWFWIAVVGELLAGALLVTGHWAKIGALLTLIIMAFAINAMGPNLNAVLVSLASLVIVRKGCGAWCLCTCKDCKMACCEGGHCKK